MSELVGKQRGHNIIRLDDTDRSVYVEFIEHCYKPNHILADDVFARWQFNNYRDVLAVKSTEGDLLSILGTQSQMFSTPEHDMRGCAYMNLMCRPEARGHGIGFALIDHILETQPIIFANAITDNVMGYYERVGMHRYGFMGRWLAVTNAPEAQRLATPGYEPRCRGVQYRAPYESDSYPFSFDDRFERLFRQRTAGQYAPLRSAEWLNWRYREMPYHEYRVRVVLSKTAGINGVIVWREDIAEPSGVPVWRICELFGAPAACEQLAGEVHDMAVEERVAYVDAYFTGHDTGQLMANIGYEPCYGGKEYAFTNWMHPAEHGTNELAYKINGAFHVKRGSYVNWRDRNNWYLTRGDSDQDRPCVVPRVVPVDKQAFSDARNSATLNVEVVK